jgi:hypothetical protein
MIVAAGKNPGPGGASRTSTLKLEMLLRENAVIEHEPGARLNDMLGQEPSREIGGGFPHPWLQSGIECRELRPQSH